MTIIKTCKKHGDLTQNQIIKSGITHGNQRYKCKLCMKEVHRNNYIKNKEKINEKTSEYKRNNRSRYNELNKYYRERYNEKLTKEHDELVLQRRLGLTNSHLIARRKLIKVLIQLSEIERYGNK